jgi:outer membrane protein TolC
LKFIYLVPLAWALAALTAAPAAAGRMAPLPPADVAPKVLTWEDCVALAAIKNPTLLSADYIVQSDRAAYLETFNGFMPNVALTHGFTSSGQPIYTSQYTASINLFNMGQVASIKAAAANYTDAQANLRLASAALRYNLRSAFATVYFADQNVDVSRRILEIQKRNAKEVLLRYKGGKEYLGNMMNAAAQAVLAEATLNQAVRSARTARVGLDQQLGLDEFSVVAVTGTMTAAYPPDLPGHLEDFLSDRPDVAVQQAVVLQQQAALASSESTLWPTLSASYSGFRTGTYELPGPSHGWDAAATLSYPIFGAGPTATYYNVKSSQRALDASNQNLRTVKDAAVADLENNWAAYGNAVDQQVAAEDNLEAARQRNKEAVIRYAAGLVSFDDWAVIVAAWVAAEQAAITARLNAVVAQAAWEQSLGKALGE